MSSPEKKIDSVYDFTDKGLVELKAWLEPWFLDRGGTGALEWADVGLGCGEVIPTATYEETILSEPSLIAYWPLNESSGDALDASGNGHDLLAASFSGPPTQGVSPGPFPGDVAQTSYSFNNDYLSSGDLALDAAGGSGVTLECWIYPTGTPSLYATFIQSLSGTTFATLQMQFRNGHNVLWGVNNTLQIDSVTTLSMSTWTHIVGTSSAADGMRIYFNGVQMATGTGAAPAAAAGLNFTIGSGADAVGSYNPFDGRIAQVALYNAVLPVGTIIEHYDIGSAP